MLKVLSQQEWIAEVLKTRPLQLNEQPVFIETIENLTSAKAVFYLFQERAQTLISFIAFVKERTICNPIYFLYSPLWVADNLSDAKYVECLMEFIKSLQQVYTSISIKLPFSITDIRPFMWNKFSVAHHYTYLQRLSALNYHETTKKNINKCKKQAYTCAIADLDEQSLNTNIAIYRDFSFFTESKILIIKQFLSVAAEAGYLKSFNCYKDNVLVASNLILMDAEQKIAYTILLNKIEKNIKDDIHSLLHDFFFNELQKAGYELVDLLGGDIQSIAMFKSRFGARLVPHFVVNYRQSTALFNDWILGLKRRVKQLIYRY